MSVQIIRCVFDPVHLSKWACDSTSLLLQKKPMLFLNSKGLLALTLTVIILLYPNHTLASSRLILVSFCFVVVPYVFYFFLSF